MLVLYELRLSKVGFIDELISLDPSAGSMIHIVLEPELYQISGSVVHHLEEIDDVTVTIKFSTVATTSDQNGVFQFSDIRFGTYTLVFTHDLYQTKEVSISVSNDDDLRTFELESKLFNLKIVVFDSESDMFLRQTSVLLESAEGSLVNVIITDDRGISLFNNLSIGDYSIIIEKDGYFTVNSNILINDDVTKYIALDPFFFSLSGTVYYQESKVNDVSVAIDETVFSTFTNGEGQFNFPQLRQDNYTLTFSHSDYETFEQAVELRSDVTLENIYLDSKPFVVKVYVYDNTSMTLLSGASVKLKQSHDIVQKLVTGRKGVVEFEDVFLGSYEVEVEVLGFHICSNAVLVDGSIKVYATLEPELYQISGSAVLQSEKIVDVTVTIKFSTVTTTSDHHGVFQFSDIRYGTYTLVFTHDLYQTKEVSISVSYEDDLGPFELHSKLFNLKIVVFDSESDKFLRDTSVVLESSEGSLVNVIITDDRGISLFNNLTIGDYSIIIEKDGYFAVSSNILINDDVTKYIALDPFFFSLSGTVYYQESKVNDVSVAIDETVFSTFTNGEGQFNFPQLRQDNYTLTFSHSDYETFEQAVELRSDVTLENIYLDSKPFVVKVYVYDNTSMTLLSGASVKLKQSHDLVQELVTNRKGVVEFEDVFLGSYEVEVEVLGFHICSNAVLVDGSIKVYATLEPELYQISGSAVLQSEKIVDVTVTIKFSTVTTTSDHHGVFQFSDIRYGTYTLGSLVNVIITDDRGISLFNNLTIGDYSIIIEKDGYFAVSSNILINDDVTKYIALNPFFFSLSGTVHYQESKVNDVSVAIDETVFSTFTNDEGQFNFPQLRQDNYTLTFSHSNYETFEQTVELRSDVTLENICLDSKPFVVKVYVHDNSSMTLLSGASVKLKQSNDIVQELVTNRKGVVEFEDVFLGSYEVEVQADEYNIVVFDIIVSGASLHKAEMYLKTVDLYGRVLDSDGNRFSGVEVSLGNVVYDVTNDNGDFQLLRVPYGQHQLSFYYAEYEPKQVSVTVNEDTVSNLHDFTLTEIAFLLSGFVIDSEGNALESVEVNSGLRHTLTNEQGFFSILLPEGTYDVTFNHQGSSNQLTDVLIEDNYTILHHILN
ncbi:hypothetical protein GEMRC1_000453 [Eukaryota sp. GEM-RC1]